VYDRQDKPAAFSDPRAIDAVGPFLPPRPQTGFFRVPPGSYTDGLLGVVIAAGEWRVVVAQAQEQNEALVESLVREYLASALWLLLPIGAATVLIGVLTIRTGLRPLREASAAAARVGSDRPGVRLPVAGLPGEVLPLVRATNAALDRLERSLDTQRRFFAAAAHALRTPLAVLTARTDALPEGNEAAALRADADRLSRLVGQLLTMARLDDLPLDLTGRVDLRQAAVDAISDLAPLAIGRRVGLTLDAAPSPAIIAGNHAAIVLALTNLLDNALTYAPPGSAVDVEIDAPATVRVLDRGPGVPEAERMAVFERFRRAPGAHSGGSGLGLAIVAEIAASHGGRAWVEARPGGGATFVLDLAGR
jgi:signal transduction histidine kinase